MLMDKQQAAADSRSIIDLVREAGVVGAGGAGFPTHVKLAAKADLVIANGAECEPLLHDGLIDMQQRLALSTVGDDQIRLGRQLYMRGKPRAAGAYHARFAHQAGNAGPV